MQIKLLTSRAGKDFCQNRGDIIEVSESDAKSMIDAGQAELVRSGSTETATQKKPKAEKANKG